MSSDKYREVVKHKVKKEEEEEEKEKGKTTTDYMIVTQILSQKISNKNKASQITEYYDQQQQTLIFKERYAKEYEELSSRFFSGKNKKSKKKDSTCLNTCCFLPRVCCNSTVFITKILISFLFILVVLAFIIFTKNLFGRIFY
jgi:hypothetical protein